MSKSYASNCGGSPAKPSRKFSSDQQPDLFAGLAEPAVIGRANAPDLDIGPELIGAIHEAQRQAREQLRAGRERIAERMTLALPELGREITKRQLDAWMADSKEFHELPARYLPALCWALGSEEPLRVIARALGYELVDARESALKELGESQIGIARLRRKVGALTKRLGA